LQAKEVCSGNTNPAKLRPVAPAPASASDAGGIGLRGCRLHTAPRLRVSKLKRRLSPTRAEVESAGHRYYRRANLLAEKNARPVSRLRVAVEIRNASFGIPDSARLLGQSSRIRLASPWILPAHTSAMPPSSRRSTAPTADPIRLRSLNRWNVTSLY
jgi:hypothetical protein